MGQGSLNSSKKPRAIVYLLLAVLAGVANKVVNGSTKYKFFHVGGCWTGCVYYKLSGVPPLCDSGYYESRFDQKCTNCTNWRCPCTAKSDWASCAHHKTYNWGCAIQYPYLIYRIRECKQCDSACSECNGPGSGSCTQCQPGKIAILGSCKSTKYTFGFASTKCQSSCSASVSEPPACPKDYSEVDFMQSCADCQRYHCSSCKDWATCALRDNDFTGCSSTASSKRPIAAKMCAQCNSNCQSCKDTAGNCFHCPTGQYLQGSKCVSSCSSGYKIRTAGGRVCYRDQNNCLSSPCQNGGTCTDLYKRFTCVCVPGWTGATCSVNIDDCSPNPCQNSGRCTDQINAYQCSCSPGYTGSRCEVNINECASRPCSNGATCSDKVNAFQCSCQAGYTGKRCEVNIDDCAPSPCAATGTCVDLVNNFQCNCAPGYTGSRCNIEIDECASRPCSNGGTCHNVINAFWCACPFGYTGKTCSVNVDECSSQPCGQNGTCMDLIAKFKCSCPPGATGVTCSGDVNECASSPCLNGAVCLNQQNAYVCSCLNGFTGKMCETNINECASSPCLKGGTCVDGVDIFRCACAPGYTGFICNVNVNECSSRPCQNGGFCHDGVNAYKCQCVSGYTGAECQTNIDECQSLPCRNGANCTDRINRYQCQCQPGYSGIRCSVNINNCKLSLCQNGAKCLDMIGAYRCNCRPGFSGLLCETNLDECKSSPCQNGGRCIDQTNSYKCNCALGYTGLTCATDLNDCLTRPCRNNGTCLDGVNSFTCQCESGFTGQVCEIDLSTSALTTLSTVVTRDTTAAVATSTQSGGGVSAGAAEDDSSSGGLSSVIIGAAAGGGLLLLILVGVVCYVRKLKREKENKFQVKRNLTLTEIRLNSSLQAGQNAGSLVMKDDSYEALGLSNPTYQQIANGEQDKHDYTKLNSKRRKQADDCHQYTTLEESTQKTLPKPKELVNDYLEQRLPRRPSEGDGYEIGDPDRYRYIHTKTGKQPHRPASDFPDPAMANCSTAKSFGQDITDMLCDVYQDEDSRPPLELPEDPYTNSDLSPDDFYLEAYAHLQERDATQQMVQRASNLPLL